MATAETLPVPIEESTKQSTKESVENLTIWQVIAREKDNLEIITQRLCKDLSLKKDEVLKSLNHRALLLLYAPTDEKEEQTRVFQYRRFLQIYPELKNVQKTARVETFEKIKTEIEDFRRKYEKKSMKVVVIFNGHGEPGYLCVGENKEEKVAIEKVVDVLEAPLSADAEQLPKEKELDLGLPRAVQLVFAQCYGHLFKRAKVKGNVEIISLATEDQPKTRIRVFHDQDMLKKKRKKVIVGSINEELDKYGEKEPKDKYPGKVKDVKVLSAAIEVEPMDTQGT